MFSFYLTGFKKLLDIGKKIFLVLTVYFVVISLFLHFIAKDKPKVSYDPIKKNREEIYKTINDPQLNKTEEGKLIIALYRVMLCSMIGEACTDNPDDGDKNFSHSLFGFMSNLIVLPYVNPPASGMYWAYSGLQNAGFVPKTYAAEGIGFAAIKPLMSIWRVFRDIAYMLLVLVLIAIGFMIMFRAKINPQTVISVENSLPKIIIALLLITFSFPIAGFLIDLMYVIILLVVTIFSTTNIGEFTPENTSKLFINSTQGGILNLWENIFQNFNIMKTGWGLLSILGSNLSKIINHTLGIILSLYGAHFIHSRTIEKLTKIVENIGGEAMGLTFGGGISLGKSISMVINLLILIPLVLFIFPYIIPFTIGFLVTLTMVLLIFRIFFILLSTYIQIVLMIVFSPLLLTLEAIPGKNIFSTWFKNLLVNILIFPLVITIIFLGHLIGSQINENRLWIPPFLFGMESSVFSVLFGLGIILIIPDLINFFKQSLGAKGLGIDIGLGAFFAGAGAAWGGGMGYIQTVSSLGQTQLLSGIVSRLPFAQKIIPPGQQELLTRHATAVITGLGGEASKAQDAVKQAFGDKIKKRAGEQ